MPTEQMNSVSEQEQLNPTTPREIKIMVLRRGFVVEVGCRDYRFAFETKDSMMRNLDNYLSDPHSVTEAIRNGTYNFE